MFFKHILKKRFFCLLVVILAFAARYYFALPHYDKNYLGFYEGGQARIRGRIVEMPEDDLSGTAVVSTESIESFGAFYPVKGAAKVYARDIGSLERGDIVELEGMLEAPVFKNPNIAAEIRDARITLVEKHKTGPFILITGLRRLLIARLAFVLPEPAAGFSAGLLLGYRAAIPADIMEDFRRTGLTHILAVSGFNIIIIIEAVSRMLMFLRRRTADVVTIIFMVFFVLLTGASASVVRAAIMGSLALAARIAGRKNSGLRSLALAACAMAFINPFIIFYDIGFQLSFGAAAGILLFSRKLKDFFKKIPERFGLKDGCAVTLAAQIFTLPVIIYHFRAFSLITLFANLIVLPFIPIIMLGGFLSLALGFIAAGPTLLLSRLILGIIHFMAAVPGAFIALD